jgi:hypothetical protein
MRNHFLEAAYEVLQEGTEPVMEDVLLTEAPNAEQEWVEKNLIKPLAQVIANINISRSHIPTYIGRDAVRTEVERLEKVKQSFIDIWHNIEDVRMKTPGAHDPVAAVAPEVAATDALIKRLRGVENPNIKAYKQIKFPTLDATKEFAAHLRSAGLNPTVAGVMVSYPRDTAK